MKEVLGRFTVVNGTMKQQTVVINQEITLDEKGTITAARKYFTLNGAGGEPVYPTDKPGTLRLENGTTLRKIGHVVIACK